MAITFRRLNHCAIGAPSGGQDKVRQFYGKVLGLKEVALPPTLTAVYEIVWFELLDFLLHIEFSHNFVQPKTWMENGVIMLGRHVALEVKDIKAVRKTIVDSGAVIHEAVALPDRDRFYCEDPFGNVIELIEFHKDQAARA
jgi:catechol 2,3-dioxygenase-like lactoylglutathione lyase family enzyme